jgi:hypothetical protein
MILYESAPVPLFAPFRSNGPIDTKAAPGVESWPTKRGANVSGVPEPLFRPNVSRTYLAAFELSADVDTFRLKLAHWADLLATPIRSKR